MLLVSWETGDVHSELREVPLHQLLCSEQQEWCLHQSNQIGIHCTAPSLSIDEYHNILECVPWQHHLQLHRCESGRLLALEAGGLRPVELLEEHLSQRGYSESTGHRRRPEQLVLNECHRERLHPWRHFETLWPPYLIASPVRFLFVCVLMFF